MTFIIADQNRLLNLAHITHFYVDGSGEKLALRFHCGSLQYELEGKRAVDAAKVMLAANPHLAAFRPFADLKSP